MELKEAREGARRLCDWQKECGKNLTEELGSFAEAAVILDNRITELEAQRDELEKAGTVRINALDDLLACYRLGRQQSEKLFNRLLESGMAWERAKGE